MRPDSTSSSKSSAPPLLPRPLGPPRVYFRMLLVGYFEGLDSRRGIVQQTWEAIVLRLFGFTNRRSIFFQCWCSFSCLVGSSVFVVPGPGIHPRRVRERGFFGAAGNLLRLEGVENVAAVANLLRLQGGKHHHGVASRRLPGGCALVRTPRSEKGMGPVSTRGGLCFPAVAGYDGP